MNSKLEIRLLGKFDVRRDGKPFTIPSRPAQSLFAYLILNAGTSHRREKLAGLLWPDSLEETARDNLRHALWRVRKALESASSTRFLHADDLTISFETSSDYWLDAAALEKVSENASADELMAVLSEYQGELLPGLYDEWVVLEREHLNSIFDHHMARLLALLEKEKRWLDILDWGERWIKLGQKPEPAYQALMSAHAAKGDMSKVAATYERCVKSLKEFGIAPSEQTRALFERLKAGKEMLETGTADPVKEKHRESTKTNLPNPITSFIGREKEVEEIVKLVGRNRLVTLTGPGGVGKTRLAIQSSNKMLGKFKDGVWWVELAPLMDDAMVPGVVAQVLGVRDSPSRPLVESLKSFLREKQLLLVLDNCEHLVDACAQFAYELLTRCENLKILATSREVMGITGEMAFQVPTLSLPKHQSLAQIHLLLEYESIRLFVERACAVKSDFALTEKNVAAVLQICQRLDGIPLAIELAAAHIRLMSPGEIERGLENRFSLLTSGSQAAIPRHQTLRAAIDWSYELLDDEERILFRRLSVFAGGFTLEAADAICGGEGIGHDEILNLLSHLVGKSLFFAESSEGRETRYHSLETIRQYAMGKMLDAGEQGRLYQLHLDFFVDFAEVAEPQLMGAEALQWQDLVQSDWDNLRSALRWSLEGRQGEKGLRIASALLYFAAPRGYLREINQILLELLETLDKGMRTIARAKGLFAAALTGVQLGNFNASTFYEESIAILRETGEDGRGLLEIALSYYADALVWSKPRVGARFAEEAVNLCRESGNRRGLAYALDRLAIAYHWMNDCESARHFLEESITIAQETQDVFTRMISVTDLGAVYQYEGKLEIAKEYLEEVKPLWAKSFKQSVAIVDTFLGNIARIQGQHAVAETLLEGAFRVLREFEDKRSIAQALIFLGRLELDRADLIATERCSSEALILVRETNAWSYVPRLLDSFAYLYLAKNESYRAARLLGAADVCREQLGVPILPVERRDYEFSVSAIQAQLDQASFNAAWTEGRAMTMEQAIAFALEESEQ